MSTAALTEEDVLEWQENHKGRQKPLFGRPAMSDKKTDKTTFRLSDFPREKGETDDGPRLQRAQNAANAQGGGRLVCDEDVILGDGGKAAQAAHEKAAKGE